MDAGPGCQPEKGRERMRGLRDMAAEPAQGKGRMSGPAGWSGAGLRREGDQLGRGGTLGLRDWEKGQA